MVTLTLLFAFFIVGFCRAQPGGSSSSSSSSDDDNTYCDMCGGDAAYAETIDDR